MGFKMKKFCPKCGNEVSPDGLFCSECGYKIPIIKEKSSIFLNGRFFLILIPFILIIGIFLIYYR